MTNPFADRDSGFLTTYSVCVIGAGGFIGSHLVDAFLSEGFDTSVITKITVFLILMQNHPCFCL